MSKKLNLVSEAGKYEPVSRKNKNFPLSERSEQKAASRINEPVQFPDPSAPYMTAQSEVPAAAPSEDPELDGDSIIEALFGKVRDPKKRGFLAFLRRIPIVSWAARCVGISRRLPYWWCEKDPDFAEAFKLAREMGIGQLVDIAHEMVAQRNAKIIMFLLKAYRPEQYSDRYHEKRGTKMFRSSRSNR